MMKTMKIVIVAPSDKACFKCGEIKPITSFYKHSGMRDGHLNKCKDCAKADTKQNRSDKLDYYKAYDRIRTSLPHRKKRLAEYGRRPEVKARKRAIPYNKVRKAATTAVNNAVRSGILLRQPCFICGSQDVQGHHPDYSRPLDVVWLCVPHHAELHRDYDREADLALLEEVRKK